MLTLFAENCALQLRLERGGRRFEPTEPVTVTREDGASVTVLAWSTTPAMPIRPAPAPTDCQRDILDVMRAAGHPMTKGQILTALESSDRLHGESTVGFALGSLRDGGMIASPGRGKRGGYVLTSGGDT